MLNSKILIEKIVRFSITGALGMVIDFGITILCKEHLNLNPYLSNVIGTTIAITFIFFMHKYWTFSHIARNSSLQFGQFLLISLLGLGLNSCIIYFLKNELLIDFYFSKVIAIGVVSIWNFTLNYLFTFGESKQLLH